MELLELTHIKDRKYNKKNKNVHKVLYRQAKT